MADRRLQVFHAVAKHLSFTKAADALFMTQPAVTFQIRQLEEHFNTRLFDRAHGRIALTPAGTLALEYAERILSLSGELDTRLRELSGEISGPLLIGASTTIAEFLLPQVLGEFKSRYPGVVPRLFVANSEAVQARIAERSLDLGFIEGDSHLPSLVTDACCEDELQVVCAPSHPLAKSGAVTPKALTACSTFRVSAVPRSPSVIASTCHAVTTTMTDASAANRLRSMRPWGCGAPLRTSTVDAGNTLPSARSSNRKRHRRMVSRLMKL